MCLSAFCIVKPVENGQSKIPENRFSRLNMIALCRAKIFLTSMKLPFVIKIFVLSILEWPFNPCLTVSLLHGA